ncbi:DeoR/GlpR family DNA-binding transcription regulator [Phytoactinopolyspora mesophila]|uniref:DeoR family transcriptional regulator n=1 Tax=Phytoactinopolyspora mesophila TaxID=2650750 RepID=A0A7K3M5H2_9ACTN|nr:DeoR/GlpR family DNA-binding transcription regulator [Phytoactinopolyspora mesophila]NDL58495.1 DeoR family transcriptional regulator [Phytoactinopolyspora mesophila]
MLAAERHAKILGEVHGRGAVRVAELAQILDVSEMTVRRDLDTLAREGKLDKVHGGATRRSTSTEEPGFEAKSLRQPAEKEAIAAAAAELVTPGSAVGLSAGTTTWSLAHRLREVGDLTVVTNSMRVADVLHAGHSSGQNVVLTGGVRTPSDALVGPIAVSALGQLHLDAVFLGVHGMDEIAGFTTPNLLEADTDRALVAAGRRLVVLADHTKWATVGISTIAALEDADVVITDEHLPEEAQKVLREKVADVRLVRPGPERPS